MDTPNASIPAARRSIQLRGGRMAGEVRFKSRGRINLMGSWEAAVSSSEPREHGSSDTTECGSLLDRISCAYTCGFDRPICRAARRAAPCGARHQRGVPHACRGRPQLGDTRSAAPRAGVRMIDGFQTRSSPRCGTSRSGGRLTDFYFVERDVVAPAN